MRAILTLSPLAVIGTVPSVPPDLRGLAQDSLNDLSAALDPCPAEWEGKALWPLVTPAYDPATQRPTDELGTPDPETRTVPRVLEPYTPPPPPVPQTCTPLQLRRALRQLGHMTAVTAAVAAADAETQEAWEYMVVVERTNPTLQALAAALEIDTDTVFRLAVTL